MKKYKTDRRFYQQRSAFNSHLIVVALCGVIGSSAAAAYLLFSPKPIDASVTDVPIRPVVKIQEVEVLVPNTAIRAGTPLEPKLFRRERRPQNLVPDTAIRFSEEIRNSYALTDIKAGELFSRKQVTISKPTSQITALIPAGFRAVSIQVNETSSVEGWARAGAFVDLAWTTRFTGQETVKIIAQHSKVLSAERSLQAGETGIDRPTPSTVTLLVSPIEAMRIQLAQKTGTVSLILRGDADHVASQTLDGTTTTQDLLRGGNQPIEHLAPPTRVKVKGRNGKYAYMKMEGGKLVAE